MAINLHGVDVSLHEFALDRGRIVLDLGDSYHFCDLFALRSTGGGGGGSCAFVTIVCSWGRCSDGFLLFGVARGLYFFFNSL